MAGIASDSYHGLLLAPGNGHLGATALCLGAVAQAERRPAAHAAKRRRRNHFSGSAPRRHRGLMVATWAR
jgi:hypothetical protein